MSATKRAQIQALCGQRTGPLIDRVESYLAAIDVWSRRGNAKAVKSAGTGVIALCCLLAAESLDQSTPDRKSALRASGLTPDKFASAERDFRGAVQANILPASSSSIATPSNNVVNVKSSQLAALSSSAITSTKSSPLSPLGKSKPPSKALGQEALLARAQAIQAGGLFDQTMRSSSSSTTANGKDASVLQDTSSAARVVPAAINQALAETSSEASQGPSIVHLRYPKRKRMSRLIFGLDVQPSLSRPDTRDQAIEQRSQRLQRDRTQAVLNRLSVADDLSWSYHDFPRDFLICVSRHDS